MSKSSSSSLHQVAAHPRDEEQDNLVQTLGFLLDEQDYESARQLLQSNPQLLLLKDKNGHSLFAPYQNSRNPAGRGFHQWVVNQKSKSEAVSAPQPPSAVLAANLQLLRLSFDRKDYQHALNLLSENPQLAKTKDENGRSIFFDVSQQCQFEDNSLGLCLLAVANGAVLDPSLLKAGHAELTPLQHLEKMKELVVKAVVLDKGDLNQVEGWLVGLADELAKRTPAEINKLLNIMAREQGADEIRRLIPGLGDEDIASLLSDLQSIRGFYQQFNEDRHLEKNKAVHKYASVQGNYSELEIKGYMYCAVLGAVNQELVNRNELAEKEAKKLAEEAAKRAPKVVPAPSVPAKLFASSPTVPPKPSTSPEPKPVATPSSLVRLQAMTEAKKKGKGLAQADINMVAGWITLSLEKLPNRTPEEIEKCLEVIGADQVVRGNATEESITEALVAKGIVNAKALVEELLDICETYKYFQTDQTLAKNAKLGDKDGKISEENKKKLGQGYSLPERRNLMVCGILSGICEGLQELEAKEKKALVDPVLPAGDDSIAGDAEELDPVAAAQQVEAAVKRREEAFAAFDSSLLPRKAWFRDMSALNLKDMADLLKPGSAIHAEVLQNILDQKLERDYKLFRSYGNAPDYAGGAFVRDLTQAQYFPNHCITTAMIHTVLPRRNEREDLVFDEGGNVIYEDGGLQAVKDGIVQQLRDAREAFAWGNNLKSITLSCPIALLGHYVGFEVLLTKENEKINAEMHYTNTLAGGYELDDEIERIAVSSLGLVFGEQLGNDVRYGYVKTGAQQPNDCGPLTVLALGNVRPASEAILLTGRYNEGRGDWGSKYVWCAINKYVLNNPNRRPSAELRAELAQINYPDISFEELTFIQSYIDIFPEWVEHQKHALNPVSSVSSRPVIRAPEIVTASKKPSAPAAASATVLPTPPKEKDEGKGKEKERDKAAAPVVNPVSSPALKLVAPAVTPKPLAPKPVAPAPAPSVSSSSSSVPKISLVAPKATAPAPVSSASVPVPSLSIPAPAASFVGRVSPRRELAGLRDDALASIGKLPKPISL
ncbi:MAG: hypothetical protein K0R63_1339, partial [Rickettsiales bacterium]|nr:hypothetical protein [Rickettsiales bacterium]